MAGTITKASPVIIKEIIIRLKILSGEISLQAARDGGRTDKTLKIKDGEISHQAVKAGEISHQAVKAGEISHQAVRDWDRTGRIPKAKAGATVPNRTQADGVIPNRTTRKIGEVTVDGDVYIFFINSYYQCIWDFTFCVLV